MDEEPKSCCQEKKQPSCCSTQEIKTPWYRQRLTQIMIITLILLILSYLIPAFSEYKDAFFMYFKEIWWAILLGFLLGGIIDYTIPSEYIKKYLSRHKKRTIMYSILFGFLMSACSHGILAIAVTLYKKGANTASVIAFLLASPWANLPITVLLFSFFGIKAALMILAALFIATTTGFIYQALEKKGWVECQHCKLGEDTPSLEDFSIRKDLKKRLDAYHPTKAQLTKDFKGILLSSWSLIKMLLWWLLLGIILASLIHIFVPTSIFQSYLGPTLLGLMITLVFATIIEVCSEGSAPLAFELYRQTGAFGNSLTFLMAGVATDYTEIGIIWQNIGKRAALFLPLITVPQIVIIGMLFNIFF